LNKIANRLNPPMISIHIRQIVLASTFLSCFLGCTASADVTDYTCTIAQVYQLKEIGTLETPLESGKKKNVANHQFTISRETGAITGKSSELDTALAKSTFVVHRGSSENSFVAVADFGATKSGTHAYRVVKVEEYRKGADKPFVAMRDLDIVTGSCK
jgi:hypothetical protein